MIALVTFSSFWKCEHSSSLERATLSQVAPHISARDSKSKLSGNIVLSTKADSTYEATGDKR